MEGQATQQKERNYCPIKNFKEALEHKRFVLDLIEDAELAFVKYNIQTELGNPTVKDAEAFVLRIRETINKHIDNLRSELLQMDKDFVAETNGVCNFSCT